ncbi:DUF2642 domain-containing protein [Paenibacillus kobensis]|uniref:DUF2642 domain-containing protein n=1 Tax=Paenibacillus kobensis TaxID=59841 RepID=UPI000FD7D38D|nr:DUF2642 domain-containing protein [Paenibacillus kobensis]
MGIDNNNLVSVTSTAVYKLLLAHIGQNVWVTTAAATVVDGLLEGVQQSYATVRRPSGDAEYVALAYIVSVSFPGA